jgi:plasmid stability protein
MGTTLTIRNLDEEVKRKLRLRAAHNQTSMEAEARAILAASLADQPADAADEEAARLERLKRIEAVRGIWADRANGRSTNEIMRELRGDD